MEGFFTKKEVSSENMHRGKALTCVSCGRYQQCESPKMEATGNFGKGILNILIAPDSSEDSRGKPYSGKYARTLRKQYTEFGIDMDEDCLNTYAVRCKGDEVPTFEEVTQCRRFIMQLIKDRQPRVICVFSEHGLYSLIGHRWLKDFGNYLKWIGYQIPDQDFMAWICPIVMPKLSEDNPIFDLYFKLHLERAVQKVDMPVPVYKEPEFIYLEDDLSVLETLKTFRISFDYETTGLKPHGKGHRIVCASVAPNPDQVYVFMMPKTRRKQRPFIKLLKRKDVLKMAYNMKFEDTWSFVRLKTRIKGWYLDTMLGVHIYDNRPGTKSLKFQTYVRLGIVNYDEEVSPYLKADPKDGNAINKVPELIKTPEGRKMLMKYCGYDSINEHRIGKLIEAPMKDARKQGDLPVPQYSNFEEAYKLLHHGTLALAEAERQGMRIDLEYCDKQKRKLTRKIEKYESKIYGSSFYRHWQHTLGGASPNLNSDDQLAKYLYDVKKIEPKKLTEHGRGSTDEEALKMLEIPELNWLINRGKLIKVRDTYLDAFVREQVDGVLHPFFNLHIARTYRSSSNKPNFQNIPKRDLETMKLVRRAIYPRHGHQLMELDYSGIEVAIAATYHKDPTMIKYITDPTTDMHGDMAQQIFMIGDWDRKNKKHGYLRSATKNSFVFPQFYGDYWRNCAMNFCGNWIGVPSEGSRFKKGVGVEVFEGVHMTDHLIENGIKSYAQFEKHMKDIEDSFWGERFPVYAKWKEKHYNRYLKRGYVSFHTGFVCGGIMGKNDVINYPVQGAAFHCLLWLFWKLTERMKDLKMKTKLIGQIHDAIVLDVHPDELEDVYRLAKQVGIDELRRTFPWINVPLEMEAELCPVDGSWAEKEDYFIEC